MTAIASHMSRCYVHVIQPFFMFCCPLQDLVFTGVFVLLFFISSCAWAAGLNDVKYWTNFGNLMSLPTVYGQTCSPETITCESVSSPKYSSLNFSVVKSFFKLFVLLSFNFFFSLALLLSLIFSVLLKECNTQGEKTIV